MTRRDLYRRVARENYSIKKKFLEDLYDFIESGEITRDLIVYLRKNRRVLTSYKGKAIIIGWDKVYSPDPELKTKLEELLDYVSLSPSEIDWKKVPENVGYILGIKGKEGRYTYTVFYKSRDQIMKRKLKDLSLLPTEVYRSIPSDFLRHELAKRRLHI